MAVEEEGLKVFQSVKIKIDCDNHRDQSSAFESDQFINSTNVEGKDAAAYSQVPKVFPGLKTSNRWQNPSGHFLVILESGFLNSVDERSRGNDDECFARAVFAGWSHRVQAKDIMALNAMNTLYKTAKHVVGTTEGKHVASAIILSEQKDKKLLSITRRGGVVIVYAIGEGVFARDGNIPDCSH
ncbi:hypothetical protein C0J50_7960 [Silurus asotus]|uniref:Uncharacterized protein n=1 Tax=Silurus asotus TaxID=30991 RepID=A0AAD5B6G7_SILAS|nr:hypothetical protein C0J50_7960 [Silurus asotus]